MRYLGHLESANDVALLLDDALGKITAQELSHVDPDRVAILQGICRSYRHVADQDRTVGFDHFQFSDALVVIAENLQQNVAARSRRKQNIVRLQLARVVRNQLFAFRGLELTPATESASAPA